MSDFTRDTASGCTVRTTNLGRDFGRVKALDGLDLAVSAGTVLTLLGPNGAGKTTLLRILMGLIEPTRGQATVLGEPSRSLSAGVAGRVAYVGDRCEPPGWVSAAVLEDLQAAASGAFDRALFRDFCVRRGLSLKQPYGAMSKGQRRWVLTSLALAARPAVILLDEPADGLDPAARKALYDAVRDHVNVHDATAIVTTHVIGDVERIADDVAIIDGGKLRLHAPLEDLRDNVRQVELPAGDERGAGVPPACPEDVSPSAGLAGVSSSENITAHADSETPLPRPDCMSETPMRLTGETPVLRDWGDGVSVLGRARSGDTELVWIKRDGLNDDELRRRFGGGATIRHVNLETLYLAIAEHRPDDLRGAGVPPAQTPADRQDIPHGQSNAGETPASRVSPSAGSEDDSPSSTDQAHGTHNAGETPSARAGETPAPHEEEAP